MHNAKQNARLPSYVVGRSLKLILKGLLFRKPPDIDTFLREEIFRRTKVTEIPTSKNLIG